MLCVLLQSQAASDLWKLIHLENAPGTIQQQQKHSDSHSIQIIIQWLTTRVVVVDGGDRHRVKPQEILGSGLVRYSDDDVAASANGLPYQCRWAAWPPPHRLWPKLASLPISPMNPVNIYRDRRKSNIGINKGRRRIVVTAFGRLVDVSVESDHSS